MAVCVALGVGNLINPGIGLDMSAIQYFGSFCRNHGSNYPLLIRS